MVDVCIDRVQNYDDDEKKKKATTTPSLMRTPRSLSDARGDVFDRLRCQF